MPSLIGKSNSNLKFLGHVRGQNRTSDVSQE